MTSAPWASPRDLATDLVLVGSLLAWGQTEVWNGGAELLAGPAWANALTYAAMSLVLLARRWAPKVVLCLQCGSFAALVVLSGGTSQSLGWLLPLVAGVYAVAAHAKGRRLLAAAIPTALLLVVAFIVDASSRGVVGWDLVGSLPFAGLLAAGWLWGNYSRTRRLYLDGLSRNAELAARGREERAYRLAAEQRNRIAHELHDVLAHGLAVTVRQAEAGQARLESRPEAAAASFIAIAETGRRSLDDVRRLMDLLREPETQQEGPVDLDTLDELAGPLSSAGIAVRVERCGELDAVPPAIALAAYRIVQEALTNALRHGEARTAAVLLRGDPGRLTIEVTDDGRGAPSIPQPGGGLIGMQARATLCGGTLSTTTPPQGGFMVTASLPWEPSHR